MIRRIYVDNYKCFVNFELTLEPLTVLVGPNGSGKTTLLDVLFALRELLRGDVRVNDPVAFPATTLTRWDKRQSQVFELDVDLAGDPLRYRLVIEHDPPMRARIAEECLEAGGHPLFLFREGHVQLYRDDHTPGPTFPADWTWSDLARVPPSKDNRRLVAFQEFMRNLVICAPLPANLRADAAREEPFLRRDGSNFAAWYRHLLQEYPSQVATVQSRLTEILPGFGEVRLERVGTDARVFKVRLTEQEVEYELRLDELSDGQRALLLLYTILEVGNLTKSSIFLDEPDNFLALPEIQPWLMAVVDYCQSEKLIQMVICSHHPEVIDYLGPDSGIYLRRREGGGITARPLREVVAAARGENNALRYSEILARGWEE